MCKTHCYFGVWSLSRGALLSGEEGWFENHEQPEDIQRMCCDGYKYFLSKLRCIFFKLTHILYPSSVLFAQLDVHRVQFSLQLPLHANIIAAPMGNWSASSSVCMHLFFYRIWRLLKWFCSIIILSCIFSFCLFLTMLNRY